MAFLPSISSDPSPRASITFPDVTNPRGPRDSMYDQGYDLKFSPVHSRDVKTSMLAYTEHMRTLSKSRGEQLPMRGSPDHLEVQARHIPRYSPAKIGGSSRRKVASFEELTGSVAKSPQAVKRNVVQREERLPLSPGQPSPVSKVRVSLVSASDLHDIVDLSLRMRGTKHDSTRMDRMDQDLKVLEGFLPQGTIRRSPVPKKKKVSPPAPRPSPSPPEEEPFPRKEQIHVEDIVPDDVSISSCEVSSPPEEKIGYYGYQKLRKRPRRAKRMKLRGPNLNAIPENETPRGEAGPAVESPQCTPPYSLVVVSPRSPIMFPTAESLSAIKGTRGHGHEGEGDSPVGAAPKKGSRAMRKSTLLPPLDLTTLSDESEEDSVKSDTKSIKLKAQKKFRKLIFLRDFPDKHYQRSC